MEVRYATRKQPWLAACQVAPASCAQVIPRLATLMVPFVEPCCRQALTQHAPPSLCGLRSDVERKNVAAIAYRFGPDRLPLPRCMGWAPGADAPVRQALTRPGAAPLGHAEGVWVCAPSGCPTSGTESGGGARQWCSRLGQVDHWHVALSLGAVSGAGHPLVAMRRYWPTAWTTAKARLDKAGGPNAHRG